MTPSFSTLRRALHRIALLVLPAFLVLIALLLLVAQFTEIGSKTEVLSLTSFIVLISFSALAFNWCRVAPSICPEPTLKVIYSTGVDLFLAGLLALVATFFAWLRGMTISFLPIPCYPFLFALHFGFLVLSLAMFLMAVLEILRAIRKPSPAE